jgi:pimeloyl-ACP methyl ester carboxylesterase
MPYVTIKNKRMYYEEQGTGFPLLLGHSYLWTARMWQPQVETLCGNYRCIVPELWGHGQSDSPPGSSHTIEGLAEDYWAFTRELGLDRFAMIGLSVGGMWGAHLTLNHPDAVAALVLMGTSLASEPEETRTLYFGMLDAVDQLGEFHENLAATVAPMFFSPKTVASNPTLVVDFRERLREEPPERIPGVTALGRGIFGRNSVIDRFDEIRIPAMVVVGEDDGPRPPHEAQAMAERIAGARLEIVPDAGHICTIEQPERVNALLIEFLAKALT